MTAAEFAAICATLPGEGGRTQEAAYRVLVDGLSLYGAAKEAGVNHSSVSRLVARLRKLAETGCPTCGAPILP